jgi:hypothetical protein
MNRGHPPECFVSTHALPTAYAFQMLIPKFKSQTRMMGVYCIVGRSRPGPT